MLFADNWQPTVPAWEKKFCTLVNGVPWSKVLNAKGTLFIYDKVDKWNDSAVEEAFRNAKNRYWAEINNLPSDTPVPGPDIYIDQIDWNSKIDPELFLDLEKEPEVPEERKYSGVVILTPEILYPGYSPQGWGDAEDNFPKPTVENEFNWENNVVQNDSVKKQDAWQDGWNDQPQTWDQNQWGYTNDWGNSYNMGAGGVAGEYGNDGNKNGDGWQQMSRYKTKRVQHDNQQRWQNGRRGNRVGFAPRNSNRWNTSNDPQPVGHYS
ncbi:hypothetical protein ACFE04_012449 [Oxalis oulophora]